MGKKLKQEVEVLGVNEVAELFEVKVTTVQKWISRELGFPPGFRVAGRRVWTDRDELIEWGLQTGRLEEG